MAQNEVEILISARDQATAALKGIQGQLDTLQGSANTAARSSGGLSTAMGGVAKVAGGILASQGIGKVASELGSVITTARDFEFAMDAVGAVANATGPELDSLTEAAKRIGKETAYSSTQAAVAMQELAANGISVADIVNGAADASVALAAAGGVDLATAATTASTAMAVWGLNTEELNEVVNRLAGAANVSRFDVEDMAMAVAQGGGAAASAGVEFGDFATAVAAIAPSFGSGSDAGTSFKAFLNGLTPTTDKAAGVMMDLGLMTEAGANQFFDAEGNLKSFADITQLLHDATKDLSEQQKAQALETLFGSDAMRAAAAISKITGEEFQAMSDTMRDTSAAEVAKQRLDNYAGAMEALGGSIETLKITIGMALMPVLTAAALWFASVGVPAVMSFITVLGDLLGPIFQNKDAVLILAGIIAGPLVLAFGALAVAAGAAAVSMLVALAPFIAVGVAIGAVIAAILLLIRHWDDLTAKFPVLAAATEVVKTAISTVADTFVAFSKYIMAVVKDGDVLNDWLTHIPEPLRGVAKAVGDLVNFIKDRWPEINKIIEFGVEFVRVKLEGLGQMFMAIVEIVTSVIGLVNDLFHGRWAEAWGEMKDIVGAALDLMIGFIKYQFGNIPGIILDALGDLGGLLLNQGNRLVDGLIAGITGKIGELWSAAQSLPKAVADAVGDLSGLLINAGNRAVDGFLKGIRDKIPSLSDLLGSITDMVPKLKGPPEEDKRMLYRAGQLVMAGFSAGLSDSFKGDVLPNLLSISGRALMAGEDLMKSLISGINSMEDDLRHQISDIVKLVGGITGEQVWEDMSIGWKGQTGTGQLSELGRLIKTLPDELKAVATNLALEMQWSGLQVPGSGLAPPSLAPSALAPNSYAAGGQQTIIINNDIQGSIRSDDDLIQVMLEGLRRGGGRGYTFG